MPKSNREDTPQTPTMPFEVSTVAANSIPAQKRLGRSSKFQPLIERLKSLPQTQALQFRIEKYTQIQGLRAKLNGLGFVITTRSDVDTAGNKVLTAYVYHAPTEKS